MKTAKEIYRNLAGIYRRIFGYPVLIDIFHKDGRYKKRALFVYLVKPFLVKDKKSERFSEHQNWWQNLEIARTLDDMEYIVDVIHNRNIGFRPEIKYDTILGMGPACIDLAKRFNDDTVKIYISTGCAPDFNNKQERNRLNDLAERRGYILKERRIAVVKSSELSLFDAVACIGNDFTLSTIRPYNDKLYKYYNHGSNNSMVNYERDFERAKYNFIYFASMGQIHKGLDLLLDIFSKMPEYNLYICGCYEQETDFVRCYKKELFATPNIHPAGWVGIYGKKFIKLCQKCAFVILPSCAEANAGAVITCMHAGLIPIVSKECGIDTDDFGITLKTCSIDDIAGAVTSVANMSSDELALRSRLTRKIAVSQYSKESFLKTWHNILCSILNKNIEKITQDNNNYAS